MKILRLNKIIKTSGIVLVFLMLGLNSFAQLTGLTGIKYEGYYADNYTFFDTATQQADVRFDNVVFSAINTTTPGQNFDDTYSVRFYGYFTASETATHTFYTSSDDASMLWIGNSGEALSALESRRTTGIAIVNNAGLHGVVEKSGTVSLVSGNTYPILIYFGENGGGDAITVSFAAPGIAKTNDGSNHYSSTNDASSPTASLAYSVGGTTVSSVSVNDVVTITATFNESIADSPVMQISGSGVETISATNMTKVSANSYTYAWTVGTGDGTQIFALATGTDTAGNVVTATPTSGATITVDNTSPTVSSFVLSDSALKAGETATVTLTFSEAVAGFSNADITVVNGILSTMTTGNNITWTGTFTPSINIEDATNILTLSSNYTDVAGNAGPSATTSNYAIDTSLPTAAITYNSVSPYKNGETLVITTTFNEAMLDSPVSQIVITGSGIANVTATNMTKTSTTVYTYSYVVPTGDGIGTISLSNGTDLAGNAITSTPTSGTTFMVDNTLPTASLAYSISGSAASSVSANDVVTITATFNESIADSPVMQISGSGVATISATNMTKVSATSYTYAWTVGTGAGTQTFALATGTDIAGNVVTAAPTSGATIVIDAPQHLTKHGKISIASADLVNKYGALGGTSGLTVSGKRISTSTPDGLTSATASTSAYQIKTDFPSAVDGLYWIANSNINSGTPFQIYADMTTDGGGWTLIMKNSNNAGWNYTNAISLNTTIPYSNTADVISTSTVSYSIIGWADYIKKSESGFQYMIDAATRGSFGAIWTANGNYSFVNNNNTQTDITINTKFGTWNYVNDNGISERMPWYRNASNGIITTDNGGGNWWGTLITNGGWNPAPWISDAGGGIANPHPGIIWYWVR